ncbi:MAG: hypothetical protein WCS42_14065 [Verrucomicrobiota bacterium]
MRRIGLFLVALNLAVQSLTAQMLDSHRPAHCNWTNAPLALFINGAGGIVPYEDGQMLRVGRSYTMMALPDRGYAFDNWQPVNVFTATTIYLDMNGEFVTNTARTVSPRAEYIHHRALRFMMQPETVVVDNSPSLKIISSKGWQANFVPRRNPFLR